MKRIILVVVLVALLVPGVLWAQDEGVTLEGLAEEVTSIAERLTKLERLFSPPTPMTGKGNCIIAENEGLHPTTTAAYMALFNNQLPDPSVRGVLVDPDGVILIVHSVDWDSMYVMEYWIDCEFQNHSKFWEEDYRGNVTIVE